MNQIAARPRRWWVPLLHRPRRVAAAPFLYQFARSAVWSRRVLACACRVFDRRHPAGNTFMEIIAMMYKVPMPTKANGVKLHTLPNEQIAIEYTQGNLHVGPMAYDSQCGILARNITFRRARPDYAAIVADAVRRVDAEDAFPSR